MQKRRVFKAGHVFRQSITEIPPNVINRAEIIAVYNYYIGTCDTGTLWCVVYTPKFGRFVTQRRKKSIIYK